MPKISHFERAWDSRRGHGNVVSSDRLRHALMEPENIVALDTICGEDQTMICATRHQVEVVYLYELYHKRGDTTTPGVRL